MERLPDWGTTADGVLCVQATPEHLTGVRDGSVLPNLPTPRSFLQYTGTATLKPRQNMGDNRGPNLEEVIALLPTPRAQNGEPRNMKPWLRPLDQPQNLENALARLLPTPLANPSHGHYLNRRLLSTGGVSHLQSNDGNGSSDDQHPPQPMIGDSDPSSSSG